MKHFLVLYRRSAGQLVELRDLGEDHVGALAARSVKEKELRTDPDIEVVLLAASSLDVLKRTHARYFKTISQLSEELTSTADQNEERRDFANETRTRSCPNPT